MRGSKKGGYRYVFLQAMRQCRCREGFRYSVKKGGVDVL